MLSIFSKKTFLIILGDENGNQEVIASCKTRKRAEEVLDNLINFIEETNEIIEEEPDWRRTGEWNEWHDHKWFVIFNLEYPYDLKISGDPTNMVGRLYIKEVNLI